MNATPTYKFPYVVDDIESIQKTKVFKEFVNSAAIRIPLNPYGQNFLRWIKFPLQLWHLLTRNSNQLG